MADIWTLLLLPVLLAASISDISRRIIPNEVSLVLVLGFVLHALVELSISEAMGNVLLGGLVLMLATLLYWGRLLGGGDVKLLAACSLWTGWNGLAALLLATALLGGGIAVILVAWSRCRRWLSGPAAAPAMTVPYGVAIAASTFWVVATAGLGGP